MKKTVGRIILKMEIIQESYKNERGEEQENNSFTIAGFKSLGDFANSMHKL